MKITAIRLYEVRTGNTGERGAEFSESQYWGGGWQTHPLIANPMSVYPEYARLRSLWMGPGQDSYDRNPHGRRRDRLRGELWRWGSGLSRDCETLQALPHWRRSFQYRKTLGPDVPLTLPYG